MTSNVGITRQAFTIIPASFNQLMLGIGLGWTAPTLQKLTTPGSEIPLTTLQCSWIGSLMEFGGIFGPLVSAFLLDTLGRKLLLRVCTTVFFISFLLLVSNQHVWAIYLSRLLFGIAIGANDPSASVYIAEVSSPKVRALFCASTKIAFHCAEFVEFIVAAYLSYYKVAIINTAIGFVGLVSTLLLIESPYFLIMKGDLEKAQKNYLWLKGADRWENVNEEFQQIHQNLEDQKKKKQTYKTLWKDEANRRSITIVLTLASLLWTTGCRALTSFAFKIFAFSDMSSDEFTILLGAVQVVASFMSILIIERYNRRTLLLTCYALSAFSHFISATLYFVHEEVMPIGAFSWLTFVSVCLYMTVFTVLHPVINIIKGELFPHNVKAIGSATAIVIESTTAFLTARVFMQICELFGIYANFVIYFIFSVVAFVFVYLKLPETRGRTLVDIQKSMASKNR